MCQREIGSATCLQYPLADCFQTKTAPDVKKKFAALLDTEGKLPILRTGKDDPDDENTLATAMFEITDEAVVLRVYDRKARADIALDVMSDPE